MNYIYLKWAIVGVGVLGGVIVLVGVLLGLKKPRVKYEHWIPKQLLVDGIMIWPWILFSIKKKYVKVPTFKHECIHLEQVRRMSWLGFYFMYLLWLILLSFRYLFGALGSAYDNHPYEKEAYARQNEALGYGEKKLWENSIWP